MKRMISETLLAKIQYAFETRQLDDIIDNIGVSPNGVITFSYGIHLQGIDEIFISDWESPLFPSTAEQGGKVVKVKENGQGFEYGDGGTKLYKHSLYIYNEETLVGVLYLVSKFKDEKSFSDLIDELNLFGGYFTSENNDDGRVVFSSDDHIVYYDSGLQSNTSVSFDEVDYIESPTRL